MALKGCQFLDEEAELSEDEEGAGVSSDEEDGEDQNRSLDGFVVDNTHYSQELNGKRRGGLCRPFYRGVAEKATPHRDIYTLALLSVLFCVRLRDAGRLFEICEEPRRPRQVQDVLQEPKQHGYFFTGEQFLSIFYQMLRTHQATSIRCSH